MSTRLERFPNEVLLEIFEYVDTGDLFHGFWGLNLRLNTLLRSLKNRSFIMKQSHIEWNGLLPEQIARLVVTTFEEINFQQFPNLYSLILCQTTREQTKDIRPEIFPHLVYLSPNITADMSSLADLTERIFTNNFPFLRHVRLGEVGIPYRPKWSLSPCIQSIGIYSHDPAIIFHILATCPNLDYLHIGIRESSTRTLRPPPSVHNHPLRRFRLQDPRHTMSFEDVDAVLACIPNTQWINLQFRCKLPFITVAESFLNRLPHLNRFNCQIVEAPTDTPSDIDTIQQLHPCYQQIQSIRRPNGYRIFTTEN